LASWAVAVGPFRHADAQRRGPAATRREAETISLRRGGKVGLGLAEVFKLCWTRGADMSAGLSPRRLALREIPPTSAGDSVPSAKGLM
jgi:hypothetical protein